jgi:hypothetical protein
MFFLGGELLGCRDGGRILSDSLAASHGEFVSTWHREI